MEAFVSQVQWRGRRRCCWPNRGGEYEWVSTAGNAAYNVGRSSQIKWVPIRASCYKPDVLAGRLCTASCMHQCIWLVSPCSRYFYYQHSVGRKGTETITVRKSMTGKCVHAETWSWGTDSPGRLESHGLSITPLHHPKRMSSTSFACTPVLILPWLFGFFSFLSSTAGYKTMESWDQESVAVNLDAVVNQSARGRSGKPQDFDHNLSSC